MPRYQHVQFEFLNAQFIDEAQGTVLVRPQEMVLEVEYPGELPYLIRGRVTGDFFAGRHEGEPEGLDVTAKWTKLDDIFIGTWVEDATDFVFTFRLPPETVAEKPPRPRRSKARLKGPTAY